MSSLAVVSVPDEEEAAGESFSRLVNRLSRQSVAKHFDAYADIAWESPEFRVDSEDPRWELPADSSPLGATTWYRDQAAATRARIGLHVRATFMRKGVQFENALQRGLLEFVLSLPNGAPEFRFAYHEIVEEGQHSLMFQEFVNRSGCDIPGLSPLMCRALRALTGLARRYPEFFFVFVLGGEDPIDHAQRVYLRSGRSHPLLRRIMQIHITEEARHLCFARQYLKTTVPTLGWFRLAVLSIWTPIVLGVMARTMMRPSPDLVARFGIPEEVVTEAAARSGNSVLEALRKTRDLCKEIGLLTKWTLPLWRTFGLVEVQ
jgi:hypothetical protein